MEVLWQLSSKSKVNTFHLLEMNYKINCLGGAKIPYFVHKLRHGALLYLKDTLKLCLCFYPGVEITAIKKYADPIVIVFSTRG